VTTLTKLRKYCGCRKSSCLTHITGCSSVGYSNLHHLDFNYLDLILVGGRPGQGQHDYPFYSFCSGRWIRNRHFRGANYDVGGDFQAIAGKSYKEFLQPGALRVSISHARHMMVIAITQKVAALFILFAGFRKAERWAWWAMLVVGGLTCIYGAVINMLNGNTFDSAVHLVAFAGLVVALLLPVTKFFVRSR
jgi:hypothetical protein